MKDAPAYELEVSRNGDLCEVIRGHHRALLRINPRNRSTNFCTIFLYAHQVQRACAPPPGERTESTCRSWSSGSGVEAQ